MIKYLFFLIFMISTSVLAQSQALTAEFISQSARNRLGLINEQSYCYSLGGVVHGFQPQKIQRIASLTKLMTTLLVSETLDLRKKYVTRIYIGKDSLHIEGGKDPYFEEEKLLLLIKSLNNMGYKSFKKITFSRDFLFYDIALGEYEKITPEKSLARLKYYLNGINKSFIRSKWLAVLKFADEEGLFIDPLVPQLRAKEISISDLNPMLQENPVVYSHTSKELSSILKTMNVQSKNLVAENLFETSSRIQTLDTVMRSRGVDPVSYKIYNGSGLPVINGMTRWDNLASCSLVLKVIEFLNTSLKRHNLIMSDVVAVNGGKDLGSLRDRFRDFPATHEAVISKTGTLMHTSSLAGHLMTDTKIPFAILNHTTNTTGARKFQDAFVSTLFDFLGVPTPIQYSKLSIFPWDGSDFLRLAK